MFVLSTLLFADITNNQTTTLECHFKAECGHIDLILRIIWLIVLSISSKNNAVTLHFRLYMSNVYLYRQTIDIYAIIFKKSQKIKFRGKDVMLFNRNIFTVPVDKSLPWQGICKDSLYYFIQIKETKKVCSGTP